MISFKQYLHEARSAPLYHVTGIENINSIVSSNTLKTSKSSNYDNSQRHNQPTVFLTRSFEHANYFGSTMFGSERVIFEIDQLKLSQRYKIKPISNWAKSRTHKHNKPYYQGALYGNEFEEVVEKPITNFLSYVTKVHCPSYMKRRLANDHMEAVAAFEKYGIPITDEKIAFKFK